MLAALDWRLVILGTRMYFERSEESDFYLKVTGSLCLLVDCDCSNQTCINDFKVQDGCNPGFFMLVSGSEPLCSLFCPASYTNVHYQMPVNKKLAEFLPMEKLIIIA